MAVPSPVVGRVFDRVGPRPLVIPGAILMSVALWSMTAMLHRDTAVGWIVAMHLVLYLGFTLVFTPLMASGLGSLPKTLHSHGSATMSTVQQLAGAVGTALFVSAFSSTIDSNSPRGSRKSPPGRLECSQPSKLDRSSRPLQ
ncbi:hypothetical protein D6T65_15295 [Arthrobacter frigidicola]|nr:hypothetical protein D6T65_15295 [Arthrobacter frigidicola]